MSEQTKRNLQDARPVENALYLWTIDQIIEDLQRAEPKAIPRALMWMREAGGNVLLLWDESAEVWECSWVRGQTWSFACSAENMTSAIVGALLKVKHRRA